MNADNRTENVRRQRHDLRRRQAAVEGRHLPNLAELLRGFPFLGNSLGDDAQNFAERLLPRLRGKPGTEELRTVLGGLTLAPSLEGFRAAAAGLQVLSAAREGREGNWAALAMRCEFCAATLGCRESAWRVAAEAVSLAHEASCADYEALEYMAAAVGWLLFAAAVLPTAPDRCMVSEGAWGDPHARATRLGKRMLDRMLDHRQRLVEGVVGASAEQAADPVGAHSATEERGVDRSPIAAQQSTDAGEGAIIVCREIGNPLTAEGKRVVKEFGGMVGAPLPLHPAKDLAVTRLLLTNEFPHASPVIDTFLSDLTGLSFLRFRPTLLVGTPGCGKTTFAQRLLECLGVKVESYSCGGIADAALAGTPRRWATGEPSLPAALMLRWRSASPGIVLDEIEKIGTSRRNGNLSDALLGLLEPQSAGIWHDPYLEAPLDLSHVLWLATANTLDGVPVPLRDRCRILRFPHPGPEHLSALASRLLVKAISARGLDPRWAAPLKGEELEALHRHWKGGSLRKLARLVDGVIACRDFGAARN